MMAKLTEGQVREIYKLTSDGWTDEKLAAQYGVTRMTIWRIRTGRSWKWLT
jgi:transcriptional regulator with XRE-family HTH domain